MSRFKSAKEVNAAVADLAEGKIDIVIGTHKLLSDDVKIKNLGLVIIDEEHRFGVRQKEQLKNLRSEVDILTLTATPIPRTLNMAVSGMRDLSIIATPPARRLSVRTFVMEQNKSTVKEALLRELLRGGQVYYLHNDVKTIEKCAADLAELVPEARIAIGHGQMRERELEQVMSDFYHKRFLDRAFVLFHHEGAHRQATCRRRGDDRQVTHARHGHVQRARNRRGGEGEDVDFAAQVLQLFFLAHSEAVLFVDDHQPEVFDLHIV